jgi:peptidyl-tRNA hydrolase
MSRTMLNEVISVFSKTEENLPQRNETKMFILIRSDIEIKASDLVPALSESCRNWFLKCFQTEETMEKLNYYLNVQPSYPKICKRFKEKHINKLEKSLPIQEEAGFPYSPVIIGEDTVGYIIGPAKREDLLKDIDALQLMTDCDVILDETNRDEITDGNVIAFRGDIEIPAGKLIPQFCHAIQKLHSLMTEEELQVPHTTSVVRLGLDEIMATGHYITDAGRTYFNKPTVTTTFLKAEDLVKNNFKI